MIKTGYGRDLQDDRKQLRDAFAARKGKAIKLRIQPLIYQGDPEGGRGNYKPWRDVSWTIDCETVEEAMTFRDVLKAVFERLGEERPAAVLARLKVKREGAA